MTGQCQSCSMTIESGAYCQYCTDDGGALRDFEEVFERFVQWSRHRNPNATDAELEESTLNFMRTMPAWQDHPRVRSD